MSSDILLTARQVLITESEALSGLAKHLDQDFVLAHQLILKCAGRVVVSGIGKSGHVGHKIASTLASTGTPAFFLHPAEASHGDLGMIQPEDIVVALSYSGETTELLQIVPLLKRRGSSVIAITGDPDSNLARMADVHLNVHIEREACPHNLAPTTSSTATLALGDALAVSLLVSRGFSAEDFARTHPGGSLGRRLLTRVSDIMHSERDTPRVLESASLIEALQEMSRGGLGITAVTDGSGRLKGIFTDGDLRRTLEKVKGEVSALRVEDVMTVKPITIGPERPAIDAAELMQNKRISALAVVDQQGVVVGAFNMHDLMRAGLV
jgi:arabinose-5-phosphate isomerase